ncbi:methylated-DNA--[protein]-cysteine S-methyltransferase [Rhodopirellula sp. JC639]|uniref:methylated-DNA--[protein]-cysteine S-methyltransferase n=1 Tax=Stieleria mannarensis TaxID=2755585 RepID=UPI001C725301
MTTTPAIAAQPVPSAVESVHTTVLGTMTSTWTPAGLYSLRWEDCQRDRHGMGFCDGRAEDLDQRLHEYFATGHAAFDGVRLDEQGWTEFTKRVYQCCREITPGTTNTYKELAHRAGNRAASRAVGAAMARNRVLLVIPCHRVVSAGGKLRGFSAPGGLQTKQFLLDLESQ